MDYRHVIGRAVLGDMYQPGPCVKARDLRRVLPDDLGEAIAFIESVEAAWRTDALTVGAAAAYQGRGRNGKRLLASEQRAYSKARHHAAEVSKIRKRLEAKRLELHERKRQRLKMLAS